MQGAIVLLFIPSIVVNAVLVLAAAYAGWTRTRDLAEPAVRTAPARRVSAYRPVRRPAEMPAA